MRLQQLRKAKYLILASILHIFQKKFLTEHHTYCTIHCVNLMIFLYLALNLDTLFIKCDFLEKFILSFFFEQDQMHIAAKTNEINTIKSFLKKLDDVVMEK